MTISQTLFLIFLVILTTTFSGALWQLQHLLEDRRLREKFPKPGNDCAGKDNAFGHANETSVTHCY